MTLALCQRNGEAWAQSELSLVSGVGKGQYSQSRGRVCNLEQKNHVQILYNWGESQNDEDYDKRFHKRECPGNDTGAPSCWLA